MEQEDSNKRQPSASWSSLFRLISMFRRPEVGWRNLLIPFSWNVLFLVAFGFVFCNGWEFVVCYLMMFVCMFFNLVVHIYFGRTFVIASTWSSWRIFELFEKSVILRYFATIKCLRSIYLTVSYFFLLWWVKARKPNFFFILVFCGLACSFVLTFPLCNVTISIFVLYFSLCIFGPLFSPSWAHIVLDWVLFLI